MNNPITITATVSAWLYQGSHSSSPASLLEAIEKGNATRAIGMLHFYGAPTQEKFGDYARVGEAEITLRLAPRDEQVRAAVHALNDKLNELRAAYLQRQQEYLDQISKLQALEYVEA